MDDSQPAIHFICAMMYGCTNNTAGQIIDCKYD